MEAEAGNIIESLMKDGPEIVEISRRIVVRTGGGCSDGRKLCSPGPIAGVYLNNSEIIEK